MQRTTKPYQCHPWRWMLPVFVFLCCDKSLAINIDVAFADVTSDSKIVLVNAKDLTEINVSVQVGDDYTGTVQVRVEEPSSGGPRIKLWPDPLKTGQELPKSWEVPITNGVLQPVEGTKPVKFWVEGIKESATTDDVVIKATLSNGDVDEVKLTLLPVEFITPAGDPVGSPVDAGTTPASIPDGANEFTFSKAASGVLTMKLKAKVSGIDSLPSAEKAKFTFELDAIGNSTFAWDEEANPGGKATVSGDFITATATYTGLPQNNSDFGLKKARIKFDGRRIAEDDFEVFFPRDDINHPMGQVNSANWFYYWMDGGVCGIPADAIYDTTYPDYFGYTLPETDNILRLCPAAPKGPPDGSNPIILTSNIVRPGSSPSATYGALTLGSSAKGIGCVAATISHELYHITIHNDLQGKSDSDSHLTGNQTGDTVADSSEGNLAGIESSPLHCDTYGISSLGDVYVDYADWGDNEIRAMKQETNITFPIFPIKDWANPGCQSANQNGPQP